MRDPVPFSLCPERNSDAASRELVLEVTSGCAEDSGHSSYTPLSQQLYGKMAFFVQETEPAQWCTFPSQMVSGLDLPTCNDDVNTPLKIGKCFI